MLLVLSKQNDKLNKKRNQAAHTLLLKFLYPLLSTRKGLLKEFWQSETQ